MASESCLRAATWCLVLSGLVASIVLPAAATTVNGTLVVAPELGRSSEKLARERFGPLRRNFWRVPNGAVATEELAVNVEQDVAVLLEPAGPAATAPAGSTAVVKLRGASFEPAVSIVTPHTKVRFRNNDIFIYELTCQENPQMARASQLPPGNQVDYTFDEPGVFEITDRRLPHVVGWVVVTATGRGTNPSPPDSSNSKRPGKQAGRGAFTFEDVAAGNYLVKVFHGGQWVAEQPLEVPERGNEIGLQIRLPAREEQPQEADVADGASAEAEGDR